MATTTPPTLESDVDATLSLTIAGVSVDLGGFQEFDGAEEAAEVVEDSPPGAQYPEKSVTKANLTNATVKRTWKEARDRPFYNKLKGNTGAEGTVGRLVRDKARNISNTEPFTCTLIRFKGPNANSNGGTNKAVFEIELAITGRG